MSCAWSYRLTSLQCVMLRWELEVAGSYCMEAGRRSVPPSYEATQLTGMLGAQRKGALRIHRLHSKVPWRYHQGRSTRRGATGTGLGTEGEVGLAIPPAV